MRKLVNKIAHKLYPEDELVSTTKFLKFISYGDLDVNWHPHFESDFCITEVNRRKISLDLFYKPNDHRHHFNMLKTRVPVILGIAKKLDRLNLSFKSDLLDGGEVNEITTSFSSQTPSAILIPDPYFYNSDGYAKEKNFFKKIATPWEKRKKLIVWRGAPSGRGAFTLNDDLENVNEINLRLRLVRKLLNHKFSDVRLTDVPEYLKKDFPTSFIRQLGIVGDYIPWRNWSEFKYAIDIDGHANAWSNFQQKLLSGCCVLKVESAQGFKQWYYDRLSPFKHYVPVKSDLSNLFEIIDWCFENENKAQEIASEGQRFAMSMKLSDELSTTSNRLIQVFN